MSHVRFSGGGNRTCGCYLVSGLAGPHVSAICVGSGMITSVQYMRIGSGCANPLYERIRIEHRWWGSNHQPSP